MFFALFFSGGKVKHRVFLILSLITSRVGPREQVVRPVCVWCVVVLSKEEEEEEEKKKKEN